MKVARDFMVEIPSLKFDEKVTKARQILRDDVFREIFIHDGKGKLIGYIDITDVLNITSTKSNVTVEGFIKEIRPVKADDPINAVIKAIRENGTDSVPVTDTQNRLLGGVRLSEIFPVIITTHRLKGFVKDMMSRKVVNCSHDDPVQKVHSLIIESGYTAFPVMKGKKMVGMVSRRDLLKDGRWRTSDDNPSRVPVEGVMTTPILWISQDEDLHTAAEMMVKHDISRLPVLEGNDLVGIIDRHDVLNAIP